MANQVRVIKEGSPICRHSFIKVDTDSNIGRCSCGYVAEYFQPNFHYEDGTRNLTSSQRGGRVCADKKRRMAKIVFGNHWGTFS